jgi:tetratricopeptide (TPR) repeat protein
MAIEAGGASVSSPATTSTSLAERATGQSVARTMRVSVEHRARWVFRRTMLDDVISRTPTNVAALFAAGWRAYWDGAMDVAEEAYQAVLAISPRHVWARFGLALVCHWNDEEDEAYALLTALPPFAPGSHMAAVLENVIGVVQKYRAEFDDSEQRFRRAIELEPTWHQPHENLATALFERGAYREGFQEFNWRLQHPAEQELVNAPDAPVWDGSALEGKTLFIASEHGHGDNVMFSRYLPRVIAHGGRVVVETFAPLVTLFQENFPELAAIIAKDEPAPPCDVWMPLMSAPLVLGLDVEDPPQPPYLQIDPAHVDAWRQRLRLDHHRLNVGIVHTSTQGAARPLEYGWEKAHLRTLPPDDLALLGRIPGIQWFSLQKPVDGRDGPFPIDDPADLSTIPLGPQLQDFRDTAAVLSCLDLVILNDGVVANLAGALGLPAWVLLPTPAESRWGRESISPWFPTLRLFRQPRPGAWASVIEQVAGELRQLVAKREDGRPSRIDLPAACGRTDDGICRAPQAPKTPGLAERARGAVGLPPLAPMVWGAGCRPDGGRAFLGFTLAQAWIGQRPGPSREWTPADRVFNVGWLAFARAYMAQAAEAFAAALDEEPGHGPAELGRGLICGWLYDYDQAIDRLRPLLGQTWWRDVFDVRFELGRCLIFRGQPGDDAEAVGLLQQIRPDSPMYDDAQILVVQVLAGHAGNFSQARARNFARYRQWQPLGQFYDPLTGDPIWPERGAPAWDGSPLNGRTLLILGDYGLGDQLHWAGLIPRLAEGGQVILRAPRSLAPLWRSSFDDRVIEVVSEGRRPLHQWDVWAQTSCLPWLLVTSEGEIPTTPYLRPDPGLVEQWRARLGLRPDRVNVAVCWATQMPQQMGSDVAEPFGIKQYRRAIPLSVLAPPLARIPGVQIYSLQLGSAVHELANLPADVDVIDLGSQVRTLADTAAICMLLDKVISVDTSVANLVGGLGLDSWVLLPYSCDWRWQRSRAERTPWYPPLRLFRQERAGDWSTPVERVADELAGLVASRSAA